MDMTIKHDKGMRFAVRSGNCELIIGKAGPDSDAEDSMSPGELFIAAIGCCVTAYVIRFCDRHDLPSEGTTVGVEYESGDSPPRFSSVDVTVNLPSHVPDKYRAPIVRAAEQCYVTQSIEHNMDIKVFLNDGPE